MSSGGFTTASIYEDNNGNFWNVRVQPETLTLTLNSVPNNSGAGPVPSRFPSAKVSGGRRAIGVNCRKVRIRFIGATLPPEYAINQTIALPVLTKTAFDLYDKGQTGTYTLSGTDYDVVFAGKTDETVN